MATNFGWQLFAESGTVVILRSEGIDDPPGLFHRGRKSVIFPVTSVPHTLFEIKIVDYKR